MITYLDNMKVWKKTYIVLLYDFVAALISMSLAIILRYNKFHIREIETSYLIQLIFLVALIQSVIFYFSGLYKGVWRFSSTPDLIRVIRGSLLAVTGSLAIIFFLTRLENISRTVFIIDWLVLIITLGGGRFSYRMIRDFFIVKSQGNDQRNVLIVGASSAGEQLLRSIKNNPSLNMRVVAFADDDVAMQSKLIHKVPVAGPFKAIPLICEKFKVHKIFIALPNASSEKLRLIINQCRGLKASIKTLPNVSDMLTGKIDINALKTIDLEDLVGRKAISLEASVIKEMIFNKTILVTGGGGSIGSELCNQIARYSPKELIVFEISEFNLYQIEQTLRDKFPAIKLSTIIGDIRDEELIDKVFSQTRPEVVLHAAAYKHVPIMERNPMQAILTNIKGTKVLSEAAIKYHVSRFVMVSTDKAVNPTNIMGATKRVAEIIVQHNQAQTTQTKFMIVRFGNVLGSSGSVVPLFQKQIQNGGPITITHPEINRFFMSISEAAQLILQASAIGIGGEIFVLDMGEPVKIVDLAKQLIALHGLEEGKDIEIKFTGLRPGEKLYEEVLFETEGSLPTTHPLVRIAKARNAELETIQLIKNLILLQVSPSFREVRDMIIKIVPEYYPQNTIDD